MKRLVIHKDGRFSYRDIRTDQWVRRCHVLSTSMDDLRGRIIGDDRERLQEHYIKYHHTIYFRDWSRKK